MNEAEAKLVILRAVRAELHRNLEPLDERDWWVGLNRQIVANIRNRRKLAGEGLVFYDPAEWMNRTLDAADRQCFSRATKALAAAGLLVRIIDPDTERCWAVELTPAGAVEAAE